MRFLLLRARAEHQTLPGNARANKRIDAQQVRTNDPKNEQHQAGSLNSLLSVPQVFLRKVRR
jgi:hypothetical protein